MILNNKSIFVLVSIIFSSCDRSDVAVGPGHSDFSTPIVGGYSLFRNSAHSVWITPGSHNDDTPIIAEKVLECAVYNKFILAKRQGLRRRSPNDPQDTYKEPDPNVFDYWILDSSIPEVYGPFDIKNFEIRKRELNIDPSVTLNSVNSFSQK